MKTLSVFVDESGDFGGYEAHSPYYIVAMVFHDQSISLAPAIQNLNTELSYIGMENHCIHTGPIIRKEEDYRVLDIKERRRIFNKMVAFIRRADIQYKCFHIEKKHISDGVEAAGRLSKVIAAFLRDNYAIFSEYENVKVYYDNGQTELSKILSSVFNAILPNVEFRKAIPSEYKLFQVADLLCTMELVRLKQNEHQLSKSELEFFGNTRDLNKSYLKPLSKKEWSY